MHLRKGTNLGQEGSLLVDPHKILNRWKNYFYQLMNVHRVGVIRQSEMHTAKPFVPDLNASKVEVAVGKLKRYRSPGVDEIPAELTQTGGKTLPLEIHKLIKLIWNREELPHQWKVLCYLFTEKVIKQTVVIIEAYHCCQLHTKC
jgi:hypothetical protein